MFRELTRKKQKLSEEDCISLLKNEKRGIGVAKRTIAILAK